MKAKIIFYSQKNIEPKCRTKFKKELSGHNDASHGGKYRYRIDGILDKIPYIKKTKGSLIIKKENYREIIDLMEKYSIKYTVYEIEVPISDFKI